MKDMGHIERDELAAYVAGLVPADRTSAIEAHVETCEACAVLMTSEARLEEGLHELSARPTCVGCERPVTGDRCGHCGAAMRAGDRLLVAELGMSSEAGIRPGHPGPVFDLSMRMLFEGGCERTLDDYAGIARAAGLEPAGCVDTGTGILLMEFRRRGATTD